MQISDFILNEEIEEYSATINGIQVKIFKEDMNNETIQKVLAITNIYPQKISQIAVHCVNLYKSIYPEIYTSLTIEETIEKLNTPILSIYKTGGVLSYCEHRLDENHIINVEFTGIIDKIIDIKIDG